MRIVSAADDMDTAGFVFYQDRIVWANGPARLIYPTLDWAGSVSFDDCFRLALSEGRISDPGILSDPEGHLTITKAFRAHSREFRFRRRYGAVEFDRYHVGVDPTWNAQVWIPASRNAPGGFTLNADTNPWEFRRHLEHERALSRVAQALDGMGVALAVLRSDGLLLDATPAMEQLLALKCGLHLDDGGRIAGAPETTVRIRSTILRVASGDLPLSLLPVSLSAVNEPVHAAVFPAGARDPAVLFLVDYAPNQNRDVAETAMAEAYGLTAQEAAVAVRIAAGLAADDVSRALDRALPTVRAQLAAIKQKVAVERQHHLAHVLTRAAAMVGGRSPLSQRRTSNARPLGIY